MLKINDRIWINPNQLTAVQLERSVVEGPLSARIWGTGLPENGLVLTPRETVELTEALGLSR